MLTRKQLEVLKGIDDLIKENKYSPTVREIAAKVGLSSTSSVHNHLNRLESKGCIDRLEYSGRSITVTIKGKELIKLFGQGI